MPRARSFPPRSSCCCSAREVTTTETSPVMAAFWLGADPFVGDKIEVGTRSFFDGQQVQVMDGTGATGGGLDAAGSLFGGFDQILVRVL
jgi:hypothetical protein